MSKWVSELYGRHEGQDIYIVGTGPSLRVFPIDLLEKKITIGLNRAWESVAVKYGITIHPELNIPQFVNGEDRRPAIKWITKFEKLRAVVTPEQAAQAKKQMFFYKTNGQPNTANIWEPSNTGRVVDWLLSPQEKHLYQWSSIVQTAINLAANMGARNIILIGCDGGALGGNHHAQPQHTRWRGVSPEARYAQYREGTREVFAAMRQRGVNIVSMSPFSSLYEIEEEFGLMCAETNQPLTVNGEDLHVLGDDAIAAAHRAALSPSLQVSHLPVQSLHDLKQGRE